MYKDIFNALALRSPPLSRHSSTLPTAFSATHIDAYARFLSSTLLLFLESFCKSVSVIVFVPICLTVHICDFMFCSGNVRVQKTSAIIPKEKAMRPWWIILTLENAIFKWNESHQNAHDENNEFIWLSEGALTWHVAIDKSTPPKTAENVNGH